jgi:hypothetical protein
MRILVTPTDDVISDGLRENPNMNCDACLIEEAKKKNNDSKAKKE